MQKYDYDILGIGNAVTDIFVEVEQSFLNENNLTEGTMKLVDEVFINRLLKDLHISQTLAGGSVANTLSTISKLGGVCGFVGNRKNDKYGKLFTKSMEEENIRLFNQESNEGKSSSLCLVLVTPNGERTMCTYLGASTNLNNNNINLEDLKKSNIVYLEGYLFDLPEAKEIFFEVVENSKKCGYKVALSLSDPFCVERYREDFLKLIKKKINILFANENEIESLYECKTEEALKIAGENIEIALATLGEKGAIMYYQKNYTASEAFPVKAIDTTGAGDNYAAGFLYMYGKNAALLDCMKAGSLCASETIKFIGARPSSDLKTLLIENKILKN